MTAITRARLIPVLTGNSNAAHDAIEEFAVNPRAYGEQIVSVIGLGADLG